MGRKKKEFWESKWLNSRTYQFYYNRLTELAISMFEWENLPDTIDARFLELTLFSDGMAIFFKDDVLGFLALQTMIGGNLNVYRTPELRTAYATNGYNKMLDSTDSVIIWNNMLRTNCVNDIELFARRLYDVDRAIDVNIKAQKTPVAILCEENQRLVMKNLYAQYDGNEPFIFGTKDLDLKGIQAINTGAPYVADKLMEQRNQIWNQALTYLGISNVASQKRERMLHDEVTRNLGGTIASRYTRLDMRKKACEQINEMFGLNISVKYREDIQLIEDVSTVMEGGSDDE